MGVVRDFRAATIQNMCDNLVDTNPNWDAISDFFRGLFAPELKDDLSNFDKYMREMLEINDITLEKLKIVIKEIHVVESSYKERMASSSDEINGCHIMLEELFAEISRDDFETNFNRNATATRIYGLAFPGKVYKLPSEMFERELEKIYDPVNDKDKIAKLKELYEKGDIEQVVSILVEDAQSGKYSRSEIIEVLNVVDPPLPLEGHEGATGVSSTGWQLLIIGWKREDVDVEQINRTLANFGIITPEQKRHFFAQLSIESMWGLYTKEIADGSAYEGRLDLGNTEPNDGPRFKGAGYIQLTGRSNYTAFYEYMKSVGIDDLRIINGDGDRAPCDIVAEEYPWEASGFWWQMSGANEYINQGCTASQISRLVNLGSPYRENAANHEQERIECYNNLEGIFTS